MDLISLTLLLAAAAIAWNWWADRQATDRATAAARRACEQAGVLWLDQNVQRIRKRLARNAEGLLSWHRDYDFEFTTSGEDRQLGRVSLLGTKVVGVIGPAPAPTVYTGAWTRPT